MRITESEAKEFSKVALGAKAVFKSEISISKHIFPERDIDIGSIHSKAKRYVVVCGIVSDLELKRQKRRK